MKMLLKRNILENLTFLSLAACTFCILLHYATNVSPITGVWFLMYLICVFLVSIYISFKSIQWVLQQNIPIKFSLPILKYRFLGPSDSRSRNEPTIDYDTNKLSIISAVLERWLVSSWYVPHISQEIGFPFSCKQMLDMMLSKAFQVCDKVDSYSLFLDISATIISHLKVFSKAQRKFEQSHTGSIESFYTFVHSTTISNKESSSADHCINLTRLLMKEIVPWELWETPHSELIIRIMSKHLDAFINEDLSDPNWLNKMLLQFILKENISVTNYEKLQPLKQMNFDSHQQEFEVLNEAKSSVEVALSDVINNMTAPVLQRAVEEMQKLQSAETIDDRKYEETAKKEDLQRTKLHRSEPVNIESHFPRMRERRGHQMRQEVKIYDKLVEGSEGTWETEEELQCLSVGQDLLASLDADTALARLWTPQNEDDSLEKEDSLTLDIAEEGCRANDTVNGHDHKLEKIMHRPKEYDRRDCEPNLLRDLEHDENKIHEEFSFQAFGTHVTHTIDHLQVSPTSSHEHSDEAAGMMEGILDFGRTNLKKGLQMTGLQDTHKARRNGGATSSSVNKEGSSPEPPVLVAGNALTKQHNVSSQDSVATSLSNGSPEPEYEEAADFATSIAKLRSLLRQRELMAEYGGGVGCESAGGGVCEISGRESSHSSRPVDTASLADEYDMNGERNATNMQRLDKLFSRTVTGVFNSLRGAVAVGGEGDLPPAPSPAHWQYLPATHQQVMGAVFGVVAQRRACSHVEPAQELVPGAALPPPGALGVADRGAAPPPLHAALPPIDLEEWCSSEEGGWWCAGGEGCVALSLWRTHLTHTALTVLLADIGVSILKQLVGSTGPWLRSEVFKAFQRASDTNTKDVNCVKRADIPPLDIENTTDIITKIFPVWCAIIFGTEGLKKSIRLAVQSFSNQRINRELSLRLMDVVSTHLLRAAQVNSLSANDA